MDDKNLTSEINKWTGGPVKAALSRQKERKDKFRTVSGIEVNRLYTPSDLQHDDFDYLQDLGFPGQYPFTRGKDPLGYRDSFWIFQQYAGFGDAEEANKRYRYLLERGSSGMSIALDLPTQIGIDSDNPLAEGEIGKCGVAIDSLQDLEIMFDGIPLNKPRQISFVANAVSLIGLAMFLALAEKQGVPTDEMVLRIQNDILKEFIARNTYIYPPQPSVRLATDLITYCAEHYPHWLPFTMCGYHIREAGSTAGQEIAFTIANALEHMDYVHRRGFNMEKIVPGIAAFMCIGMDFFEEIAKYRAMRRLWARTCSARYNIQDRSKLSFNLVNFTAGSSLTAQQPMNNIIRVTIECLAGVLGGCQSLFPCSMDEAFCTPTEQSVKIALRTQQIVAHETGIASTIDPLAGSYYVESLTNTLEKEAQKYLSEIENLGGSLKAIETGYFQQKIRESSYDQQKAIQNKERIIVGVNEYIDDAEIPIEIFRPSKESAQRQKDKLKHLKETRDNERVRMILKKIEAVAESDENLTPILVEAVKNYVTIGEISDVFRKVFGEYREADF